MQEGVLLRELLRLPLQLFLLLLQLFRLPVHLLLQQVFFPFEGARIPAHEQVGDETDEQQGQQSEPPAIVHDGFDVQRLFVLGQDVPVLVHGPDLDLVFSAGDVSVFDMGVVLEDGRPVLVQRQDAGFVVAVRPRGVGQVGELQGEIEIHLVLVDGIREQEVVERPLRPVSRDDDFGIVPVFRPDVAGAKDAEPFFLAEVDGPVVTFHDAVLAESHGLEAVAQAVAGHLPVLGVQARKAVLRGDPQIGPVQQEARDLAVRQPVFFGKDRDLRLLGQAVVQPVQAVSVRPGPEGVPVGDQGHADRQFRDLAGFQGFQVDGVQALDAAHQQLVRRDAGPEAGGRLAGISRIGRFVQVIDVQSVVGGNPDVVVDGVVRHPEDDVDAPGRFRQVSFRVVGDVGAGQADVVQAPGLGAEPEPAPPVLAESCDLVVGECGVFRVVVAEQQVPDRSAQAVSFGRHPQTAGAVQEHPDRGGRNGGGGAFDVGKIGDGKRFPLDDGQSFGFQPDPDLPVPGHEAPHQVSRKEGVPVIVGMGAVGVELLVGGVEEADAAQGPDEDFPLRRQAEAGDFVVREGVPLRFGMLEAGVFPGGDIDPVQAFQGPDPDVVPGAQIGGGLVVLPDVDPGQDLRQGQPLVRDRPDLEEASAQGDPRGTVVIHVVDPGHEAGVRDVALQGVDDGPFPFVGEGHPVQDVVRDEPQAAVGVPVHVSRRMGMPPRPGHPGERIHPGKRFQVQDVHPARRGDPQPAEAVFAALVDEVVDERRIRLRRVLDEGIAVVPDQPSAEGADPGEALAVEVDSVDILVRQPALPGQSVDDEIVFRLRVGQEPSGEEKQPDKNCN